MTQITVAVGGAYFGGSGDRSGSGARNGAGGGW
jgi:hypothetical protein